MPALLIYLLKVNVALLLFCLGYYTVLRRLTFYTLNRVYLLLAIVFCSLYPAINFTDVVQNHRQLAKPLQVIIIDLGTHAQNISKPVAQTNYWQWLVIMFWAGVALMTIRLIVQLWSLFNLYRRSEPGMVHQQQVRLMAQDSNPFSFWQYIYINPALHSEAELSSIIAHEQVHVKQWHTLDVLLAELSLIFYWFNPGVWMMKKAINENLEFITDRYVLQQGADAKSYQYSLLYTCVNTSSNAIVNHFNISTIKKRITMMNSKKSPIYKLACYSMVLPTALILLLNFNTSKAALYAKKHALKTLVATNQPIAIKPATIITPPATAVKTSPKKVKTFVNTADTTKKQPVNPDDVSSKDQNDYIFYSDDQLLTKEQLKHWDMRDVLTMIPLSVDETEKVFGVRKKAGVNITMKNKDSEATKALLSKIEAATGRKIELPGTVNGSIDPVLAKTPITVVGTDGIIYDNNASSKSPVTINLAQIKASGMLVVMDDKPQSAEWLDGLNKMPGSKITNVAFLNKDDAIAKYGDKGSKGAVLITTTFFKNKPKN